jgi:hypothetical protein
MVMDTIKIAMLRVDGGLSIRKATMSASMLMGGRHFWFKTAPDQWHTRLLGTLASYEDPDRLTVAMHCEHG